MAWMINTHKREESTMRLNKLHNDAARMKFSALWQDLFENADPDTIRATCEKVLAALGSSQPVPPVLMAIPEKNPQDLFYQSLMDQSLMAGMINRKILGI